MRNRLSFVLLAAGVLGGCPSPVTPVDTGPPITIIDSGAADTNRPDTNPSMVDTGVSSACSGSGRIGSHCQGTANTCVTGSTCVPATANMTVQAVFGLLSGTMTDPAHPDYQLVDTSSAAETAPFNGAAGGLCAEQCDTSVADTCGTCTSCSATLTQMPLIAALGGVGALYGTMRMYGTTTGVCRLDCTYDPATSGAECPDQMTCDQFGNACVESCTSDNECNTAYGVTYEGELVTLVNHTHADVCNMTTGRCDPGPTVTGSASATVGTHCEDNNDCALGDICLNGGHCASWGCANAGMQTGTCGGTGNTLGICLPANETAHTNTLCLPGCNNATDCGAGNICNILYQTDGVTPFPIGTWTGYCIGQCDTDDQCIAAESCTDYNTLDATGAVVPNPGRCVPRCTALGQVGTATTATAGECLTTEWCEPDISTAAGETCTTSADCHVAARGMCFMGLCRSAAPSFGQCTPLGAFCGAADTRSLPAQQADCAMTQVCDETLATPHDTMGHVSHEDFGDGHCTDPCTMTSQCTTANPAAVCVTTGPLTGLCRVPCTATAGTDAGMGVCPTDQVCDGTLMYCVEVAPPA